MPDISSHRASRSTVRGDSQATYSGTSPNNYWISNGFLLTQNFLWDYFNGQTTNSSSNVPSRANITGSGASMVNIGSTRDILDYPSYGGVQWHETASISYSADIVVPNSPLGNGWTLNPRGVNGAVGSPAFTWPSTSTGKPWNHDTHMRASLVYLDHSNAPLLKFGLEFARVGASANNSAAGFQVDITGASRTNALIQTAWSAALADAGTYNSVGGANYPNDREERFRLYSSSDVAYNENGLSLLPLCVTFARSNSGGVFTTKSDGSRLGFSCAGRTGSYVSDHIAYSTQAQTQNYFANVASLQSESGTRRRFTLFYMFGHNASGTELSGGAYTTTFRDNYITLINRDKAAILAQWADAEINVIILVPWRSGESGQNSTEALSRSLHSRCLEVAGATGAYWFSWAELHGHQTFMYPLHPQEYASGARLSLQLNEAVSARKGGFLRGRGR